jgi:hypothetical protein
MDSNIGSALALRAELEERNIELKVEGQDLALKVPSGKLQPALRDAVTAHKQSLLDLLQNKPVALRTTCAASDNDPDEIPAALRHTGPPCAACDTTDWWIPRRGMLACSQCHPYLRPGRLVASLPHDDDLIEAYEERAAIMEYEAGMPRCLAELAAARNQQTGSPPEHEQAKQQVPRVEPQQAKLHPARPEPKQAKQGPSRPKPEFANQEPSRPGAELANQERSQSDLKHAKQQPSSPRPLPSAFTGLGTRAIDS